MSADKLTQALHNILGCEDYFQVQAIAQEALAAHQAQQAEPVAWMRFFQASEDEMDAETIVGRTHPNELGMPAIAHPDWEPLYAAPQPAHVQGWQLVPVEPTPEMLAAVVTSLDEHLLGREAEQQYREDWAAMLAAAPQQGDKT